MTELPHLRAACDKARAAWTQTGEADDAQARADWDYLVDVMTFAGKVAAILALGVFLFVAMAVL